MNKLLLCITFLFGTLLLKCQTPTASFANWKNNNKAAYTIIHDDFSAYVSGIYDHADRIATPLGIKFCFGAITHPDQCGPAEWVKARTMVSHGHECINHSHTHRCGGSASACSGQLTYGVSEFGVELGESSTIIQTETGVKPLFFIHPYDAASTAIENYLTGIGYLGARGGTQEAYNASNFTDFMHLNFYVYAPGTAISSLDQAVSTTIAAGGYAIREFHGVDDPSWGFMTAQNYENHLNFVKAQMNLGNLWSATASEVITYKMQRDAYQPSVTFNASSGQVNVNFTNVQTINTSVLKTPVTVNVDLKTIPSTNTYTVSQNGNTVAFTRNANIITFNVYPHQGNVVLNCTNCALSAPTVGTITQPTCTLATGSVVLNNLPTGNWTINPGGITGSGSSKTISGLLEGTYSYTVTNASGSVSPPSANIVINPQPNTPNAPSIVRITQPTCTVPKGSVEFNGLPAGNWTINPGNIQGSTASTIITNLNSGNYSFKVTNSSGCISSGTSVSIITAPNIPVINAPNIIHPTCTVSTGTITVNATGTGSLEYSINNGVNYQPSAIFSGLNSGSYTILVRTVGTVCVASISVTINAAPIVPTAPSVGTITQPTCTVQTGRVVLNGLPSGNWTINPGNITGSGASRTITNLVAATYNYTVTNASGCISLASANVVINAAPIVPTAPSVGTITQPTCTVPTGSVVLNGLPATGNWTINPGNITGSGVSRIITGLAAATYNYTVTNASGCISLASANVVINAAPIVPTAPSVGTITQPTCTAPTGSVVLNGLPATGNWIINPGNITGSGASRIITGLASATYNYTVTNASGCISLASANVVINAAPIVPTAPSVGTITQPTCTVPTGSVVLNDLPTTGNWTINPGNITGSGASRAIIGLATGTYNFTVTNTSGCTSLASPNIVIDAVPSSPKIGESIVTQPTCTVSTGTIVVNATGTGTLEYSINGGTSYQTSATFSELSAGSYPIAVRFVGSSCSTTGSTVVITASASAPSVSAPTVTQPTCSVSTGTIVVNATGTGTLEYSINGGTSYQTSETFSGLGVGSYPIAVRVVGSICSTTGSTVVITASASAPSVSAPTVTQPTCTVSTGTIVVNATGTGTLEYSINGGTSYQTSAIFSGLGVGSYVIAVRFVGSSCSTTGSTVVITASASTPSVSAPTVTQPTCSVSTGTIVVNATGTGTLEYSINGGTSYQTSAIFSGLGIGSYPIAVKVVGSSCSTTGSTIVIMTATGCCSTTIPPTVTLTSPVNGGVTATNLNFAAAASDVDGTISNVNFYWVTGISKTGVITRTLLGSDNTAPYTFTWTNIPGGNYNVQAEAVDNCGVRTFSSISNVIVLETMSVIITSPLSGQGFVAGENITIASSVINYSSRTVSKLEFYIGGVKVGEDLTAPYTFNWANVQSGNYALSTKAIDNFGGVWNSPTYLISFSGTFTNRQTQTGRHTLYQELTMLVSPNPAQNEVVLKNAIGQEGDYTITLTDFIGRVMITKKANYAKGENTEVLDISKMPKGIYLVNLKQVEGGQSVVQKLIID